MKQDPMNRDLNKHQDLNKHLLTRRRLLGRGAGAALALALGRFGALAQGTAKTGAAGGPKLPSGMELAVSFEVLAPTSGRAHRPYVAAWIEDENGEAVRTLSLWAETSGRGPRYISELRRWFRTEEESGTDLNALIATVSGPTRNPGSYTLAWDGKTDGGALASQGAYYVCVESAREHGPYSLVRGKVALGASPLRQTLGDDAELKDVSVEYRKRA